MFTLHQLKQIMASLEIIHQSVYAWLNLSFYTLLTPSPLAQLLEHQMKHITSLAIPLTGGNWQKWKRVFLTCPFHKIYRDEAVGLKSCKYTWKITKFVKMGNLGQYRENLIFCQ